MIIYETDPSQTILLDLDSYPNPILERPLERPYKKIPEIKPEILKHITSLNLIISYAEDSRLNINYRLWQ